MRCRDLPLADSTISQYGEYSHDERFCYTVTGVAIVRELIFAEGGDGEMLSMPFGSLASLDTHPAWNTLRMLDDKPFFASIMEFNECGISVYEDSRGFWYLGIGGCGYDFYEAHWMRLYRMRGIHWHSTLKRWKSELVRRVSSYVKMCAENLGDIPWSNRREPIENVVDAILDPKAIEDCMFKLVRICRLWHATPKLKSIMLGEHAIGRN